MAVFVATTLLKSLNAAGVSKDQLVKQFAWWKEEATRLNQSVFFGRDIDYTEPQLLGRGMMLRHAHMIPLKDDEQHQRWLAVHKRRGEKTSDKCIVYSHNGTGDYLLLHIFDEPGAHATAWKEMATMRHFYRLAVQFADGDFSVCEAAA